MGTQGWNVNLITGQLSKGPLCITSFENTLIVFYRGNDADTSIYYTTSTDGINWAAPLSLWNQGVSSAMSATVANGNVYLLVTGNPANSEMWMTYAPLSSLVK